jgi:hypothetical protein
LTALVAAIAALGFCAVAGCSPGRQYDPKSFPVEGSVRWKDGTDASGLGGTIEFEANGKVVAKTELLADGTFTRDEKLPEGKYRVRVVAPPPAPDSEYVMDARFQRFESSGLTVTVGSEEPQRISLVLTRTARPNRQ